MNKLVMMFLTFICLFYLPVSKAYAATSALELQAYCQKGLTILEKGGKNPNFSYEDMLQSGRCFGLVEGVLFAFIVEMKERNCKTFDIPYLQGVHIFLEYMNSHQERQSKAAAGELWLALIDKVSCEPK